ncbi:conserved hypothetical protein [Candidatus Magnetomoraceae bacterium gMMP-15]
MKYTKIITNFIIFINLLFICQPVFAGDGFTQKDRELLIRLQVKMEEIDKRFEQVDKRFEQVDKRFEQVNNRFDDLMDFLYILSGIFTAMVASVIGFAYWDRRTILAAAREEVRKITKEDRVVIRDNQMRIDKISAVLRRMSIKSPDLKELLNEMRLA